MLLYLSFQDEFSHLVQQWNIQRNKALERALTKILYPQMEKELRLKLVQEAKEGIQKVGCSESSYPIKSCYTRTFIKYLSSRMEELACKRHLS